MLVRALKLLDYSQKQTVGRLTATAALIQPGDEGRAYDRRLRKWQRISFELFVPPQRLRGGTPDR
jgi:hypothetical protein